MSEIEDPWNASPATLLERLVEIANQAGFAGEAVLYGSPRYREEQHLKGICIARISGIKTTLKAGDEVKVRKKIASAHIGLGETKLQRSSKCTIKRVWFKDGGILLEFGEINGRKITEKASDFALWSIDDFR